ncbi:MAG: hypothetical protein COW30_12730 [Rhodospirillales bacterium CG15_BIG_FIL_POST_REV_8_21_14_020_66_15]|nr:MAG: hypothetical protein COW30_12730 [Rhodospirillales bacterium CG15_BIG_FIL_POST_REV_8_21_14_020_66_15]
MALQVGLAVAQTPPEAPGGGQASPEPGRGDTVTTRPRPEFDPIGVRLGGFFLYPSVGVVERYHSNIFFTDSGAEDDFITVLSPSLVLKSNWNNHALNLFADSDIGFYASNSDENYQDAKIGFDGRLDILRDAKLTGGFTFERAHEDRSSPDQTSAAEPVTFLRYHPKAAFIKRFNRLSTQFGADLIVYDYDDASTSGGATLNMDDRNRHELQGTARVGYEIAPRYEAFVRGSVNDRRYTDDIDDSGFERDSHGWEVAGGLAFDLSGVTSGNLFAGYLTQEFDDPAFSSINGVSFGGDLTWNPTRLTTVTFQASRTVEETTLSGAAGALVSDIRASVDHELRRNIILSADLRYRNYDYENISRDDDVIGAGFGGTYLVNRHARLRLRYGFAKRESNTSGADYDAHTVLIGLVTQY